MFRPGYSVQFSSASFSSGGGEEVVGLRVEMAKNDGNDEAVILLGHAGQAVDLSEGEDVSIELGWDGTTELVFTGVLDMVERRLDRTELICRSNRIKLMKARGNQTFLESSAGDIVSSLASEVGLQVDCESGIQFPVYHVDSSISFYSHCLGLARRCGFDLYMTGDGTLVFAGFRQTAASNTFAYGERIIRASVEKSAPLAGVTVIPESPASSSGDSTFSWLVKDSSQHQAQAGDGSSRFCYDPALRSREAADITASAMFDFSRRNAVTGYVELIGSPEVKLGDAIGLEGFELVEGEYQVAAVSHQIDKQRGFRSIVSIRGMV